MSNDKYSESDLRAIFFGEHDDFEPDEVAEFDDGSRRWHHDYTKIIKHKDGSLWAIQGSIGLTECQENEFYYQPYKVDAREQIIPAKRSTAYCTADGKLVGIVVGDKVDAETGLSIVADSERPDFAGFAASLRAEADGTAEIWRTGPDAHDKQREIKALRELADKVEQVGKLHGFI